MIVPFPVPRAPPALPLALAVAFPSFKVTMILLALATPTARFDPAVGDAIVAFWAETETAARKRTRTERTEERGMVGPANVGVMNEMVWGCWDERTKEQREEGGKVGRSTLRKFDFVREPDAWKIVGSTFYKSKHLSQKYSWGTLLLPLVQFNPSQNQAESSPEKNQGPRPCLSPTTLPRRPSP